MKGLNSIRFLLILSIVIAWPIPLSVADEPAKEPPVSLAFDEKLFSYHKELPKEAPPLFDFSGGKVFTRMVWGKEWRVEKVEDGLLCSWGDEKVKWVPKPWHPAYYKTAGPTLWDRWADLGRLPWVPLEERREWNGAEWWHISSDAQQMTGYAMDRLGESSNIVISPKGKERVKKALEWWRSYFLDETKQLLPENERNVVMRKYYNVLLYPDDVKGMSFRSLSYFPHLNKPDENWLYLPSVRKVRRLSEASREDYVPGAMNRNEDYVLTFPIHNYKVLRAELFKDPGPERYGYGTSYQEQNIPRLDSIGAPCLVIEVTPYKEKWWFAKLYRYINILGACGTFEEAFNSKGERIRDTNCSNTLRVPDKFPFHLMWADWGVYEYDTGYRSTLAHAPWERCRYGDKFEEGYDVGIPESLFTDETMVREVRSLYYWR